jgi:hypothetical protein
MLTGAPAPAADFEDAGASAGAASSSLGAPTRSGPLPPQLGLTAGVGVGKTETIIATIRALLAANPDATTAVFVPDHSMSAEMARRVRAGLPGVAVKVWFGIEQPDPAARSGTHQTMCPRSADAAAVRQAGGALSDLCGSKAHGFCPRHPEHPNAAGDCGYIGQSKKARLVRVWIMTHAMLGRRAPSCLRRNGTGTGQSARRAAVDLVVIDESFFRSMLNGPLSVPIGVLYSPAWPFIPDRAGDIAPGFADRRLRFVLDRLHGLVARAANHDRIPRAALQSAGVSAQDCRAARWYAFRCKTPLPTAALPAIEPGKVQSLLKSVATDNRRVLHLAHFLRVAADILEGTLAGAAIRVFDGAAGREVKLRWREPIHDDWALASGGIVHADGTMQIEIATVWLPRLVAPPTPPIAAPHVRVTQIVDRALGYSTLIQSKRASAGGNKAADSHARRLRRAIETIAERYRGKGAAGGPDVLVVLPKALEDAFRGKLPSNVGTLHFGKLRGQDAFKGVAALVVVSRPLPPPSAAEDTAEIIFGRDVTRLPPGRFYDKKPGVRAMADGTGLAADVTFHPDPDVEAVRWAACEAELIQAIGRGRGVRRTAANPLDVVLLTNVPLAGVLVSEAVTFEDLLRDLAGPVREMIRAGVLPLDWPGREAMLTLIGVVKTGARKRPGDAGRQWFRDNPVDARLLAEACAALGGETRLAVISHSNALVGAFTASRAERGPTDTPASDPAQPAASWPLFRYRRAGSRQGGLVLVSPDHSDPKAVLEAVMGALDLFEQQDAPVAPKRRQRPSATRAVAQSVPSSVPVLSVAVATPATPAAEQPRAPQDGNALIARLDAVPLGLPPVADALVAAGAITIDARRRYLDGFRRQRGTLADRERATLAQIARDVGADTLHRAARAAAARKLGVPVTLSDSHRPPEAAAA